MSFRYVIHLKTGQTIRSGTLKDSTYDKVISSIEEFMSFAAGARSFEPEEEDTDATLVFIDRTNVSHIVFLPVN